MASWNVNGKLVSEKEFDSYWFSADPYEAIFNHMPEDGGFALVEPAIDLPTYQSLIKVDKAYFELGFDGKETYQRIRSDKDFEPPKCYSLDTHVEAVNAPKSKQLQIGREYQFQFYIPRGRTVAIIDSEGNWTYFESEKGIFSLDYTPSEQGELNICVKLKRLGRKYSTFIVYEVPNNHLEINS
ncbi:MAG: hypothetical protein AAF193_11355 [Bacteroidota bacterium]